jgi:hypothetical protein
MNSNEAMYAIEEAWMGAELSDSYHTEEKSD